MDSCSRQSEGQSQQATAAGPTDEKKLMKEAVKTLVYKQSRHSQRQLPLDGVAAYTLFVAEEYVSQQALDRLLAAEAHRIVD